MSHNAPRFRFSDHWTFALRVRLALRTASRTAVFGPLWGADATMATCAQSTKQEDGVTQQLPTKPTDGARALDGGVLAEPHVRRRLAWVPLSLVMLSLAGLAITPLLLQHYTRELRLSVRM